MTSHGLTYHQLHQHFWECGIAILDASLSKPALENIIVRTAQGDHHIAAIWREGNTLYFDLGQPMKEEA